MEESGMLPGDARCSAMVAAGFCRLLSGDFTRSQKVALEAAYEFWGGAGEVRRLAALHEYARIIDADGRQGTDRRSAAVNRLIWSSLNSVTGFSGYTGEFLMALGSEAGLNAEQMAEVLTECIPGL
jgi:hypothetical protein